METSLTDIDEIMFYDSDHYQLVFAILTSLVKKYDFSKYIYDLLYDIVFNIEELFFVEKITIIKELYPDIYKGFYKEYSYSIRQSLIYSIKNMMYYYQEENDLDGLYFLKRKIL